MPTSASTVNALCLPLPVQGMPRAYLCQYSEYFMPTSASTVNASCLPLPVQ